MKTLIKPLATLIVAATMTMVGCQKEKIEPITPATPPEEPIENIFAGTWWTGHLENTYMYQEQGMAIQMEITYDLSLDFLDSTNAELFHDLYVYVPIYPAASQSQNMTEEFTYTFSKDSVFLNGSYIDEATGDTLDYSYALVYDKDANTLTLDLDDPEMEEMMGTTIVVFTQEDIFAKTLIPAASAAKGKTNWNKILGKIVSALRDK